MEFLDPSFAGELLSTISPFAIGLAVTFATAELIFQWFMRIVFGHPDRRSF